MNLITNKALKPVAMAVLTLLVAGVAQAGSAHV